MLNVLPKGIDHGKFVILQACFIPRTVVCLVGGFYLDFQKTCEAFPNNTKQRDFISFV